MEEERTYNSLTDMRRRRRKLRNEIAASEKVISHLWKNIFHGNKRRGPLSSSQRFSRAVSTGASILDGAILGWKLYRKFKRG